MPEGEGIEKFHQGQFSPLEGDDIDPEELKKATRRLHKKRSGQNDDGSFDIEEEKPPRSK
jgi:hypothetical protein